MNIQKARTTTRHFDAGRERLGVTLTEVLMSVLIMGIGVISLMSLFPLSVVRTLQATNLTNAALLVYDVEAFVRMYPTIVHDPDGDGNQIEHFNNRVSRRYLVDPAGIADRSVAFPTLAPVVGNNGEINPTPMNIPEKLLQRFAGANTAGGGSATILGMDASALSDFATLPDSWSFIDEGIPEPGTYDDPVNPTSVTFLNSELQLPSVYPDPSASPDYPEASLRITFFDLTGEHSVSRSVSTATQVPNGWTITWSDPLPGWIMSRTIARAVVQSQDRRYTWMLAVRKQGDGRANVDVVVSFKRDFDPEYERVYAATFLAGFYEVPIRFNNPETGAAYADDPFLKKGGFILDTQTCRFYRITDVAIGADPTFPGYDAVVTLETPVLNTVGEDVLNPDTILDAGEDTDGDGALDYGHAVFMRGIVDVYPIGTISP